MGPNGLAGAAMMGGWSSPNTVRLRPTLASLPAYVPGRNVPGAIKLASNEVVYPPLPSVLDRIAAAAATINRYPDSFCTELTGALAQRHNLPFEQVVVGCGSVSLCQQLVNITAGPGDEVLFAWRSFEAYPIVTIISGATAGARSHWPGRRTTWTPWPPRSPGGPG